MERFSSLDLRGLVRDLNHDGVLTMSPQLITFFRRVWMSLRHFVEQLIAPIGASNKKQLPLLFPYKQRNKGGLGQGFTEKQLREEENLKSLGKYRN
jgi:hypothetical protein